MQEDISNVPKLNDDSLITPMTAISFTISGMQSLLHDLDPNKAQDPNKIAPTVLKDCAAELLPC